MALSRTSKISIAYHLLFNYPLSKKELVKWRAGEKSKFLISAPKVVIHFKIKNERRKISLRKMKVAIQAANILKKIPTIKMLAVTGSLAMMNAREDSDIDLMIVTSKDTLWTTRLLASLLLTVYGLRLRRAGDKNEKDKLCLNIWLDESDLKWTKKNIFTAHEICQIMPLVNKDKTYEKFLWQNKWVLDYWPKAVKIQKISSPYPLVPSASIFEKTAFWLQYQYMKPKITRETVTRSRALFHPIDWSARLEKELGRG